MAGERRDWLILSMKRSDNEWVFRWYDTAMCGYTSSLIRAGRYTEGEARGEQRRVPHHLLAVKLEWVADFYAADLILRNEGPTRERLAKLSEEWSAMHPLPAEQEVKGGGHEGE
jgi:CelD/BcsL family acetyltransferase involved in cellulose biosynthesis